MTLTLRELFDKSKRYWGLDTQINMLAEESSELALASLKLSRHIGSDESLLCLAGEKGQKLIDHLAEEIADTQFMIDEMLYYFQLVPKVVEYRKQKEARLRERIRRLAP